MTSNETPPRAASPVFKCAEQMKGYVTIGETDFQRGYVKGREMNTLIITRLSIRADDVFRFVNDSSHEARLEGSVQCDALWRETPIEKGVFNLFVDTKCPKEKRMKYRLFLQDATGPLTVSGFKALTDDNRYGIWSDCSILYVRLFRGHVGPEDEERAPIHGAGLIFLYKGDFLTKNVVTFRITDPRCIRGFFSFFKFFMGTITSFWWAKFRGGP